MASANARAEVKLSIPITSWFRNLRVKEDQPFLADLDVHVGQDATFKAHKNILGLAVPYFAKMFQKEVKNEVWLPKDKISANGLRAILKIVYGEEIGLSDENVQEIHKAALFLGMNQVAESCFDFMKNGLNAEHVIPDATIGTARQHDCVDNDATDLSQTSPKDDIYCLSKKSFADSDDDHWHLQVFDTRRNSWGDVEELSWISKMRSLTRRHEVRVDGMFRFRGTPHLVVDDGMSFYIYRLEGRNAVGTYRLGNCPHRNSHHFSSSQEGLFAMVFDGDRDGGKFNVLVFDLTTPSNDDDQILKPTHDILIDHPDCYHDLLSFVLFSNTLHMITGMLLDAYDDLYGYDAFVYNLMKPPAELQSWEQGVALVSTLKYPETKISGNLLFVLGAGSLTPPRSTIVFCMDMSSKDPKWIRLPTLVGEYGSIEIISAGGYVWLVNEHRARAHKLPLKDLFSETSTEAWIIDEKFRERNSYYDADTLNYFV